MSQSLNGVISIFQTGQYKYPFFTSGDLESDRAVVFVGGLTNGMAAVPFTYSLSESIKQAGWKLVQYHWSSAYGGYGTGSLDRDRTEMRALVKHLRTQGVKTIVIAGHSTGSQNVIHYLSDPIFQNPSTAPTSTSATGGIMQAPASDREFLQVLKMNDYFDVLPQAEKMIAEGKGEDLMDAEFCKKAQFGDEMKITAYRTFSLAGKGGDDDYFSDDIPNEPTEPYAHSLSTSFGALSAPALVLYSDGDIPYQVGEIPEKLKRWQEASKGKLDYTVLKGASHDVCEPEAQVVLCDRVVEWLKRFE
ncbi:dolichol-phosphate mannosyltransferase [Kwoniella heveanensis BCC8398]|uniref:Dolichol-phosphate mannosyltransferase n=1 Tax=Kwoniella heveanensis BCC8398 TaxID=1296120 RepID=A0A1B9GU25_9TREE|nr:dolichol-phosphate mannosyltransferase [Kwoniella heveanensis BCC8398]